MKIQYCDRDKKRAQGAGGRAGGTGTYNVDIDDGDECTNFLSSNNTANKRELEDDTCIVCSSMYQR